MMTGDWTALRLVAHRCGGAAAPENSLAGLDAAARLGVGAVEFDVMLSADREPFLIHDETLDRTTDGAGRVADTPARVLDQLSCARGWGPEFATERLPRLEAALTRCRQLALRANIEIKPSAGQERITGKVVAQRAMSCWSALGGDPDDLLFSSFSVLALEAARDACPGLRAALLLDEGLDGWLADARRLGLGAVHCSLSMTATAWFQEALKSGLVLRVYTVNRPSDALRLLAGGVSAVFSDRCAEIGAALLSLPGLDKNDQNQQRHVKPATP